MKLKDLFKAKDDFKCAKIYYKHKEEIILTALVLEGTFNHVINKGDVLIIKSTAYIVVGKIFNHDSGNITYELID